MKTIGMVIAVEMGAVWKRYGTQLQEQNRAGYRIYEYQTEHFRLVIVNCGAGEIAAAAGTQLLISEYGVELVINLGVVGGLTEEMKQTTLCIVEKVVHYSFDVSGAEPVEPGRYPRLPDRYIPVDRRLFERARALKPELKPVICGSADRFVATGEEKRALHETFGADICEMEAAGILLTCNRNGVPCMLIKIVSDGIRDGIRELNQVFAQAAALCMETVDELLDDLAQTE